MNITRRGTYVLGINDREKKKRKMLLVIDNTRNQDRYFSKLLARLTCEYKLVQTQLDLEKVNDDDVSGILLSGSPLMVTRECVKEHPDQFALNVLCITRYTVPVLGICFGCQLLNVLFGGTLLKLEERFCADSDVNLHGQYFKGRFCLHYVMDEIPSCFRISGFATLMDKRVPCVIQHRQRRIYGYLFHPEYHPETHCLVTKFLQECASQQQQFDKTFKSAPNKVNHHEHLETIYLGSPTMHL